MDSSRRGRTRRGGGLTAPAAWALVAALALLLPAALGFSGGMGLPPGMSPKLIPVFVTTLSKCGDATTVLDAVNVFTGHQAFITELIQKFGELEVRAKTATISATDETISNPFVDNALKTLTSDNMTELILDPSFESLSDSLDLACVMNQPEIQKLVNTSAEENIQKGNELDSGYNSLDKLTYYIEAGLMLDLGKTIMPAFQDCDGNLRILLQFAQAYSHFILGNRRDLSDKQEAGEREQRQEVNPALAKYASETPEELYETFQCQSRYSITS